MGVPAQHKVGHKVEMTMEFLDNISNNDPPSEEALRDQEANILQLGERFREEGRRSEMTDLIQKVRVVLKYMSKAKAAKLVRGLVDMFLEMKTANQDDNGELGVQVCKECIEWAKEERRTFLRQSLESRLIGLYYDTNRFKVQLLESKTYHALGNLPKARAA